MTRYLFDSSGTFDYTSHNRSNHSTESSTIMRIRTIVIVTILIAILTVTIAFIASEFTQYSNPITIQNGKAMIATTNGAQAYADVEYISGNVVSVKPMAINVKTPIALPNTSAAHGAYTCQVTDDKGMTFTVTSNNVCEVK